ncbi:hypothetical protein G3480_06045 [Thiorhodococcus mannitoliphagus]|uniref:Uncharacterized protein n=1 Tax=Thiorhodococcus mannitoliphagus TaxID=329406 RepID=A0A6P1DPN7_9GAMM|nr:hypothetical protein [Thiorhodococcus mannitoliphagus]NEX19879.1 hypothetical protein [Thiorhodococcus mannitoliphagus]
MKSVDRTQADSAADQEQVARAAAVLERIVVEDWPEGRSPRLPILLLRALCRLAGDKPEQVSDGWGVVEITAMMQRLGAPWSNLNEGDARQRLNSHWRTLQEAYWQSRQEHVRRRFAHETLGLRPRIDKSDAAGGRGNTVRYFLRFEPIEGPAPSGVEAPTAHANPVVHTPSIRYYPVELQVPRLLRWIPETGLRSRSPLGGLIATLLTGIGVLVVLSALMTFYLGLHSDSAGAAVQALLRALFLLGVLRLSLGWWWDLAQNNLARAPLWWQSFTDFGDTVIERRFDPTGFSASRLHLVRYVADCPRCGAEGPGRSAVRLASGRLEFWGRIVGRCRNVPNEHVWSFDHGTGEGRFLR